MNIDGHYWMMKYLAMKAGMGSSSAELLSFFSQMVDEARDWSIHGIITQCYNANAMDGAIRRFVFAPFHFYPADSSWVVLPGFIGEDLRERMRTTSNLYWLSLVVHVLLDTYSHQNFRAIRSSKNKGHPKTLIEMMVPAIGHAMYDDLPDIPEADILGFGNDIPKGVWIDPNGTPIRNDERFLLGADDIWETWNKTTLPEDMRNDILSVLSVKGVNTRRVAWMELTGSSITLPEAKKKFWNNHHMLWIGEVQKYLGQVIPLLPLKPHIEEDDEEV